MLGFGIGYLVTYVWFLRVALDNFDQLKKEMEEKGLL